ncbi:hypothetical protein [Salimicrobium flavidum]|uniref:Uncharacterized protein n=1 Tax=Salimicrobium flavidum TaxID=570947 RepID=A0A1N7J825_9BACI|nr:hypothetical protein [Salimicrobium flavidum]SIS45513.1 hypothetical protein SAMN05421687_104120 [Salimicrobium flavidum]
MLKNDRVNGIFAALALVISYLFTVYGMLPFITEGWALLLFAAFTLFIVINLIKQVKRIRRNEWLQ